MANAPDGQDITGVYPHGPEALDRFHGYAEFLGQLAYHGLPRGLATFEVAAGKAPTASFQKAVSAANHEVSPPT